MKWQSPVYMPEDTIVAELVDSAPAPSPTPDLTPAAPSDGNTAPDAIEIAPVAVEDVPTDTPAPEEALYELPDGRKVDAETLQREWKENFYPEFTRKSQALADIQRATDPNLTKPDVPEWKRPDYVPKSYAELIEIAENRAIERLQETARAEQDARAHVASQVDGTIAAIKAVDPKLDENSLFQHANKYGFTDLTKAYENMTEMRKVAMTAEERAIKNIQTRKADPVAGGAAPAAPSSDAVEYGTPGKYSGALEYLRSLNTQ